jgi:hypothetical protein
MATKLIITSDGLKTVYDDRWTPIVEALASDLSIERVTDVEYSQNLRIWEAIYRPTGQIIARERNRNLAIDREIDWLEQEVIN